MQKLFNRRDFVATAGVAGVAAAQLFSFPLSANAQGARSSSLPRGTYLRADANLDLLFTSGTTALDLYHLHPHVPEEIHLPDDIGAQTHMAMRNMTEVLDDQGVKWQNVVKVNRFQTDITESAAIEAVLAEYFVDWWPAMTAIEIRNLSSMPARLEIEMIAVVPSGS